MRRCWFSRLLACATAAASLVLLAAFVARTTRGAQPTSPNRAEAPRAREGAGATPSKAGPTLDPAPAPAPGDSWARDELLAQAREEVETVEAYLRAKQAQLREVEARAEMTRIQQQDVERQLKKGLLSSRVRMHAQLAVAEIEAEREQLFAELKDLGVQRERARRRIALIEQGHLPAMPWARLPGAPERLRRLELASRKSEQILNGLRRNVRELTGAIGNR